MSDWQEVIAAHCKDEKYHFKDNKLHPSEVTDKAIDMFASHNPVQVLQS